MRTKRFEMPALFGDHHVVEVRRMLLEMPGVTDVYASSAFHVVDVTYDEKKTEESELTAKLEEAGYLGNLRVPEEAHADPRAEPGDSKPFFRHTAVYETTKTTVAFAQQVGYEGRPLWHCPGIGTIRRAEEETDRAKEA
jgi:copper chaperone CopZ